ncbi:stress-inducible protein [Streptomyces sp. NE5-10]|uniref:universal stress protein n=1 Tax=Streptomyces sp. NE5-10 TaxID=2759674 RepID=UPI0019032157|nr:universal stress protein [Streptomyces sp. NE5-10]GHJ96857.1 stress-inducible protein [Streptomyces sp. NE5-10]
MNDEGIVVGIDGSDEAEAAALWAADEASLRGTGLRLLHARQPWPDSVSRVTVRETDSWAEELLTSTAAGLRERHPGLSVSTRIATTGPVPALVEAAEAGALLVLGSRALSGTAGYLVGSVGLAVAGVVERPVVLVRAGGDVTPEGSVVVGIDARQPADAVLAFSFAEAARRRVGLTAVYAQQLPFYVWGPAMVPDLRLSVQPEIERTLEDTLDHWRAKHPEVATTASVVIGSAGLELVRAASGGGLVVVGRRTRRSAMGTHIGSVAHAVLHHSRAPVALVPHD